MNIPRHKSIHLLSFHAVAFTLVEMLVVIAILMVISAMLLPALVRASASASGISCTNNLKQMGYISHSYVSDNYGIFPLYLTSGPWTRVLINAGYITEGEMPVCPSAMPSKFSMSTGLYCSYGLCGWPSNVASTSSLRTDTWMGTDMVTYVLRVNRAKKPSTQIFYADSIYRKSSASSLYGKQFYMLWRVQDCSSPAIEGCPQLRHLGNANSLFVDIHVAPTDMTGFRVFTRTSYLIADEKMQEITIP